MLFPLGEDGRGFMSLKKLAGETVWYGVSNIAARLLTYILTPYFTYTLTSYEGQIVFGKQAYLYSLFPILTALYTYGMETSYFRFSTTEDKLKLYRTQLTSIIISTLLFTGLLLVFRVPLAQFAELEDHAEYIGWCAAIIGLDTLSALPYARLRQQNRPRKYAFTKIAGILVYVITIVFLFSFGDDLAAQMPGSAFARWYGYHWGVGFILFANILQAAVTLLLLFRELKDYRPEFDAQLWRRVFRYGFPILITGFAGWMNESLNRVMFQKLYPATDDESLRLLGFYTAALRLSIIINLFIQAFKMAAEPFFFSISKDKDAPVAYARIMKWLVILLAVMFLNVVLYLDIWQYFMGRNYRQALDVVPILLLSYIFIGIYYNLTVWYKLTDKTQYGTYIVLVGSVVTVLFNWLLIPTWGYYACAWGTLLCNGIMMVLSYTWGQKFYPVPYNVPALAKYLGLMLLLFAVQWGINMAVGNTIIRLLTGTLLFLAYFYFIYTQEREELKRFPLIGKFIKG